MLERSASANDWNLLTSEAPKRHQFSSDLYFRECWPDWVTILGSDPHRHLHSLAMLCAKPDAVVARRLRPMLQYVIERGFQPIGVERTEFNRHSMREIWRYDWHVYPVDRLDFSTRWFSACPTLTFFLRDTQPIPGVPASVRLSDLKGGPVAAFRRPDDMRSVLAPPNRVLNFVHIPDEPADIVRELGILFERNQRINLIQRLHANFDSNLHERLVSAIDQIESEVPVHDLDIQASMMRLQAAGAIQKQAAAKLAIALANEEKLGWDQLTELVDMDCKQADRWDIICLASWLIPLERTNVTGLLETGTLQTWRRKTQA
ncbi:hypothetical protein [Burkholderia sp. LMG 21824]|uniref:hypothetical protein n=1 Tax=Burkholderia sp. LMG 21824 TaxID=3158172 RepID=UPI003C2E3BBB